MPRFGLQAIHQRSPGIERRAEIQAAREVDGSAAGLRGQPFDGRAVPVECDRPFGIVHHIRQIGVVQGRFAQLQAAVDVGILQVPANRHLQVRDSLGHQIAD